MTMLYRVCQLAIWNEGHLQDWFLTYKKQYVLQKQMQISWLHRASTILNPLLLPTDAHNVKKRRVTKTS